MIKKDINKYPSSSLRTLADLSLSAGERVLIRTDFNIPVTEGGIITDTTKILAAKESVTYLLGMGAILIIISHFKRPKNPDNSLSLLRIKNAISESLNCSLRFAKNFEDLDIQLSDISPGEAILFENIRFWEEEELNDQSFAKQFASRCSFFVNEAFACSHRKHASIETIARLLPSFAGFAFEKEFSVASNILKKSKNTKALAIIGGSKLSTKLPLVHTMTNLCSEIIIGGALSIPLIAAKYNLEYSNLENLQNAKNALEAATDGNCKISLPIDGVYSNKEFSQISISKVYSHPDGLSMFDIGPESTRNFINKILEYELIFWNGPMGMFEKIEFCTGSAMIVYAMALAKNSKCYVGGGDSVALVKSIPGVSERDFSFVFTAGGALIEFFEKGGRLPGIDVLEK